jgi:hypothetical protein
LHSALFLTIRSIPQEVLFRWLAENNQSEVGDMKCRCGRAGFGIRFRLELRYRRSASLSDFTRFAVTSKRGVDYRLAIREDNLQFLNTCGLRTEGSAGLRGKLNFPFTDGGAFTACRWFMLSYGLHNTASVVAVG